MLILITVSFREMYDDALHVAIATCHDISYLISWNFEHFVKVKTRKTVNLVNILEGYKEIEVYRPKIMKDTMKKDRIF